ncbi:MAG: 30S ribosome-binding factor RbfA [Ruminococcus sp.]|nr:30S ribosome-binding factor RbfA [Ruminococcus sp.]
MPSYKAGRMAEDIRRIVFAKMRELKDPRIGGGEQLTITRCEVAHDGSYCKVYVSGFGGEKQTADAVKGLTSATGIFKREISNVLGLRKSPDLKFIADLSGESSQRIFDKLKAIGRELDEKAAELTESGEE